ncbi:MAG: right-handed parallel beta-helix repeat-containing protein [Gammaproteobacteria bacterium]|nr:right-handed parallel beta-helix repeat-containing protein [Gammaproteobacteria bacterium]
MKQPQLNQFGSTRRGTMRVLSLFCMTALAVCLSGVVNAGTVFVPMPVGDPATDWENVQAAVDSAIDGDTVQFGPGAYVFGVDSDFIVVEVPEIRLVGHPLGTTIVGGEVMPILGEPGSPWLIGNNSLLQSPPRGFYLTADEQRISNIRFEGFRTAILIGYGDFFETGGYVVEDCEFIETVYGVNAHVESDKVTAIRGNAFINSTFPYDLSGGRYHVSYNYLASPDPDKIPIDFTHHSGVLAAGGPFYDEGGAFVTEHNLLEFNIVNGGVTDGFEVIGDAGGLLRNNIFRNNEFYDMQGIAGLADVRSYGGDIVDSVFVNNNLDGSGGHGLLMLNFGGTFDGNLIVGNELTSVAGRSGVGVYIRGTTNTIFSDNVITGVEPGALYYGTRFYRGHSNQFLLNDTDADTAAWFSYSPEGLFASDNSDDVAVDEYGDLVESLDPNQDFNRLLKCEEHLKDTESVEDFRECVDDALEELH